MPTEKNMQSKKHIMSWLVLAVVLFVGVLGAWYLLTNEDKGNTANANGAISNNISATSDQEASSTFANLIVHYPASWASQKINGSDSCMGLVSPELKRYNEQWRQQNPDVTSTDAVITNDVTICNAGSLSGELTTFAEKILREEGAAIQSSVQVDQPFAGAFTYDVDLPTLHQQIFYKLQETVIRAIRVQLPYDNAGANSKLIDNILRRVEVDNPSAMFKSTFTAPNNVYSIHYPSDWKVPLDKGRVIYTFTPSNVHDNSCYLSLSTEGLLGHGGVTFPKGKDENINISGVSVTKHVWVNESGRTMYFNIEINKGASTIGLEASTGSVSSDCSQTINEMIKTLKIQP